MTFSTIPGGASCWQSYGAYGTDGYVVIGFPITFGRMRGFAGIYEFHTSLLIADVLIALAFAALVGWATVAISLRSWGSRSGFQVATKANGGTAAD